MFQDGPLATITPASLPERGPRPGRAVLCEGLNTPRSYIPDAFIRRPQTMLACGRRVDQSEDRRNTAHKSGSKRFPFNNFTCFLTLFPKCFSSFDHSTCALSVSGRYLALEEIYLPFRAAFPNNSTRRRGFTRRRLAATYGILTLCDVLFQGT